VAAVSFCQYTLVSWLLFTFLGSMKSALPLYNTILFCGSSHHQLY
jgi:hypothetical protein